MHMTAQQAFESLADCMSLVSNDVFFARLVKSLALILGTDHVFVARLLPDRRHASTLAVWSKGRIKSNFVYSLDETPCRNIDALHACFLPHGVSQRFPHNRVLAELDVEAYLGVPIVTPHGRFVGLLATLSMSPLANATLTEDVLRIASVRAGAELMRLEMTRALDESQQRLQTLISHLPGMVYRCLNDPEWTMEFVSEGALELTGYPASDFINNRRRSFLEITHPDDRQRIFDEVQASIAQATSFHVTYRIITASGETRWLWEQGKAVADASRSEPILEGFICDITKGVLADLQRETHERQLIDSNRALTLLSQCNERLVHADDEAHLLHDICALAVDVGGYRMAWVGFPCEDEDHSIAPQASAGVVDGFLEEICLSWSADNEYGRGPSGRALRTGDPQVVADLTTDSTCVPWAAAALARGYHGIICLPLKNARRTFGVLVLYQNHTTPITEEERSLLCDLADDLAFGIDTLRARQRQKRIQHAVMQIATAVSTRSGDAYFVQLAQHMASALGANASFVVRLLPDSPTEVETLAAFIDGERHDNFRYIVAGTPCQRVLQDGEVVSNDYRAEAMSPEAQQVMGRVCAYAGRRLDNAAGKPVGMLSVMFRNPIEDQEFVSTVMRIFAAGAAAEMERQRDERRIRRLAYIDISTELPNRTAFRERLDRVLKRKPNTLSLLFLDLNRFKEINDIHGHDVGDIILAAAANRFKEALKTREFLARLGGDEFVVMLEGQGQDDAIQCARRLQATLDTPCMAKKLSFNLEVSIGIACYPEHAHTARELLQHADIAMYQAKHQASRYCLYQATMGHVMAARLDMAKRLSLAIDQGNLMLHFQAQVDMGSGRLVGAEALCRWHDDELGWISPGEFIPLAEERGMICQLGNWVIEAACRQLSNWRNQGIALPGQLAINVASQQLDDKRLMQVLEQALLRYNLAPEQLTLELTESSFMSDPEQAVALTGSLKARGFGLAIDDFGTGYSSLAYLKRFAADKIKIDISFVRDMLTDANDYTIVKTIIAMAQSLGLETIAEGIEQQAQADALKALGCHQAQGFFYARPQPAELFAEQWLRPT